MNFFQFSNKTIINLSLLISAYPDKEVGNNARYTIELALVAYGNNTHRLTIFYNATYERDQDLQRLFSEIKSIEREQTPNKTRFEKIT